MGSHIRSNLGSAFVLWVTLCLPFAAMSANKKYSKAQMARSKAFEEEYQERAKKYAQMDEARVKKTHHQRVEEYSGRNYWQPNLRYSASAICEEEKTGIKVSQLT